MKDDLLNDVLFRIRALFRKNTAETELNDELQFHLDKQVEKHMRAGLSREEAMRVTRLEFGGLSQVKEDCRESRGVTLLENLCRDVTFAFRQLRRTPGFSTTALLTLALGIGANSAIFTLVNAILEKNLPVTDPKTLVRLGDGDDCCVGTYIAKNGSVSYFSTDSYERLKKNVPEFEELAAMQAGFGYRPVTARREGTQETARSAMGEFVSGNYFRTFGLQPEAGRLFVNADDVSGTPPTAVMSYENWQNNYGGDLSVVGNTFRINTKPVTIVGIAPKGFYGDRLTSTPPDFYLPIQTMPVIASSPYVDDPGTQWLYIIGRIRQGQSTISLAEKLSAQLREQFATRNRFTSGPGKNLYPKIHIALTPAGAGIQTMQKQYGSQLHLLMWVSGLVLLIACANIANLLLVRGIGRRAELSVRSALGAARGRIVRQLLTESMLLAGIGGFVGLAVSYAGTRLLLMLAFPGKEQIPIHALPSIPVLAFAIGLSLLTGVLFGVAPAWLAAKAEPIDALRSGSRTVGIGGISLLQRGLVVLQIALSVVLLVGAGLFLRSLNKLESIDLKLEATNRYIVHFNPQAAGYGPTQLEALYRTVEQRFHQLPGISRVGIASYTPMEDDNNGFGVQVQGQPILNASASRIRMNAEYFDSVGTHVVMGRGIQARDTSTAPPVAVVNQSFVRKFFRPGENALGRRFGFPGPDSSGDWEIVGVVEDTAYSNARWKDHAMYFIPLTRRPLSAKGPIERDDSLYVGAIVLDTDRPMNDLEPLTRKTLASINPNLAVVKFQTFDEQIADQFTGERLTSRLTLLFGVLALLLATIGIYGVTAYSVATRTREIGIRMALGGDRWMVISRILGGAIKQTTLGLAVGTPVAFVCVRFVKSQLYEITNVDLNVLVGSVAVLTAAAFVATIIPARRAASINPMDTLRLE